MARHTAANEEQAPDPADSWSVAEAKARFSELLQQVDVSGPQVITRRGEKVAVVVSTKEWHHKTRRTSSLAEFFDESPLPGSGLEFPAREKEEMREVVL